MRLLLSGLLLFNSCHGWEGCIYPQEDITYAGMTIQCVNGCGTYDDPDMQKIWSILKDTINKAFGNVFAFDATSGTVLLQSPVRCNDSGDYERWDWQATNGVWQSDNNMTSYKEIWIGNYPTFLQIYPSSHRDWGVETVSSRPIGENAFA